MPNDYIDQVKLTNNTVVDIKDTVSGYITTAQAPVQSVNGQTGTVSLSIPSTASDVGAIAAPSSASSGQFLKYNGTSWIADNVPGGASPSDTTPAESTETGSAGTSSAYSRGDHSHPKEIVVVDYNSQDYFFDDLLNMVSDGKTILVRYEIDAQTGEVVYLPYVRAASDYIQFECVDSSTYYQAFVYPDAGINEWDISSHELAPIASPSFTGNPTAPTQTAGNNSTRIATTAFVQTAISGITDNDTKTSFYGTSTTGATTQAKTTTTITDYALRTGNIVAIKFSNANTYTSNKITLNVSSTGAKDVWYQGAVTSSTNTLTWNAGQTLTFVYTGSVYICISKDDIVPDVTFVEYGVATEAEVYAAQGNGKLVIAFNRNSVRRCAPLVYYAPASKYVFSFVDQDGSVELWELSDNGTNTWSSSTGSYYVPKTRTVNSKALSSNITLDASDVGATPDGLVYASQTAFASVAALQTQLTTWFNAMSNQTERIFYITFSSSATGTIPFAKGTGIIIHLQKGTSAGMAVFYGRTGNPATGTKVATMSYVSSAWSEFTSIATTDDINTAIGSAILASY